MYDYFLGGSHNFPIDRQAAEQVTMVYPDAPLVMRANRAFLRRAVRYLVPQGVDQFLDIGSGIPTVASVHEIAHRVRPDARVVYVDSDPIAVHHSRALLKDVPPATVIQADARQPDLILSHPEARRLLDFSRPIGLLLVALLPFIADDREAYYVVRRLRESLPSGSFVAISHGTYEDAPRETIERAERLYANTSNPYKCRWRSELLPFFEGLDLVEPGIVHAPLWRPEGRHDPLVAEPARSSILVGVGRKA